MLASQYLSFLLITLVGRAAAQDLPGPEPTTNPASPACGGDDDNASALLPIPDFDATSAFTPTDDATTTPPLIPSLPPDPPPPPAITVTVFPEPLTNPATQTLAPAASDLATLNSAAPLARAPPLQSLREPTNGATLGIWRDADSDASNAEADASDNDNNATIQQVPTTLQTIATRPSIPRSTESALAPAPAPAAAGAEGSGSDANRLDGVGRTGRVLPTPTPAQHGLLPMTWGYGSRSSSTESQ